MVGTENDSASVIADLKKVKEEVYGTDTKIQILKYRTEVIDSKVQRLNEEAEFVKGTKSLSREYKSNTEMLTARVGITTSIARSRNWRHRSRSFGVSAR
jgi:hypothetical protein